MRSSNDRSYCSMSTASGGIARLACARLQEAGKDAARILANAGFTLDDMVNRKRRLNAAHQMTLLELVAMELQDDCFGLHLAQDFELGEIGLLYYVMASSERLADALGNAERYCTINNEGVRLKIRCKDELTIAIDYVDVSRHPDRHHIEFWVLCLIRVCRAVTDTRLAPRSVKLRHVRPRTPRDIRAHLGCEIQFGADTDEISFSGSARALAVAGADAHLNRLLLQFADEALGQRAGSRTSLRSRVENEVAQLLPHGKANLPEIARRLAMSRRTLARALADEGTTFSDVREPLRQALATRYLKERELPVSEVAWLLGYGEASSFTKAFTRWTGVSPRDYRKAQRVES